MFASVNNIDGYRNSASPPPMPGKGGRRMYARRGSWRLDMLQTVINASKSGDEPDIEEEDQVPITPTPKPKLSSQTLRALWKKAILETVLLIRMEKENSTLKAFQDAAETKRLKLDYEEITPCLKEVTLHWEEMLRDGSSRVPFEKLLNCVKAGVPQRKRGDIWGLLVEQHRLRHPHRRPSINPNHFNYTGFRPPTSPMIKKQMTGPHCRLSYQDLLKKLTPHQHAILIDLGRTFPGHPYFNKPLGPGQLALFNLLKAYSLIDQEVGYCQGLSFVAGILLMHMREEAAFETLEYMMFTLGARRQYKPDMVDLQIKMYQLSRLLHDFHKDLYEHFEDHDISPTLYAAPWFLTLFSSQFPIGFVSRVFDLIFLEGAEVIFKVALVLLGNHKELIKQYSGLEAIVDFLKTTLPEMGIIQMERVINQVFTLDVSEQLQAYEVEYHVLQEEMLAAASAPDDATQLTRLEKMNVKLKRQNMELLERLQTIQSQQRSLELTVERFQTDQSKMEAHMRSLEMERTAMLNTIVKLKSLVPAQLLQQECIPSPTQEIHQLRLTENGHGNLASETTHELLNNNTLADLHLQISIGRQRIHTSQS